MKLTKDEQRKFKKAMYRCVDFIELFFPDPKHPDETITLGPYQKDFIDYIQFGFPFSRFRKEEVEFPPKGVIFITRRQVGKSFCAAKAVASHMMLYPNTKYGIVAASETQAQLLIEKVKESFDTPRLEDYVEDKYKMELKLKNGSMVRAHTCSLKSIKGPAYEIVLIDESAIMDEEILFEAAIPTVTHGKRWVAITTPKGRGSKLVDYFYKGLDSRPVMCRQCGKETSQSRYNVTFERDPRKLPELPDCECGANDYKLGVGDFGVPYLDPWDTPLLDSRELKRELDLHGWSPWARQELLGEIIDEASEVILEEWLNNACDNSLRNRMHDPKPVSYVVGIDYGRQRDASCICVTHKDGEKIVLDYMRTISGEFDHDTDYSSIRNQLLDILIHYDPVLLVPDSTGMGLPEVERIQDDLKRLRRQGFVKTKLYKQDNGKLGFIFSHSSKPDLIGNMLTLFSIEPCGLRIPPKAEPDIDEFWTECLRFGCEVTGHGHIKYGTQNYHDDRVIAFALSLWGHRRRHWFNRSYKTFDYVENKGKTVNVWNI